MSIEAFLLTRGWRDARDGVDLEFWAWSSDGPLRILVPGTRSTCWVETDVAPDLPDGVERVPSEHALLGGGAVDALRSVRHNAFRELREAGVPLCESDVSPADRWLMRREVRAGFAFAAPAKAPAKASTKAGGAGGAGQDDGAGALAPPAVTRLVAPELSPADVRPTLEVLSLDLEMRANTRELYSIAGALLGGDARLHARRPELAARGVPAAAVFMIGRGPAESREGYTLYYARDERHCLERFFGWLALVDPDVLSGWSVVQFDLNFIGQKCAELGVPFALGRGREPANVLQPSYPGGTRVARVPGRVVMDGIDLVKAALPPLESYSLEAVSRELLELGKRIAPEADKVGEINRMFRDDKPGLADYNVTDCTLVNDIIERRGLVDFAVARAALTGLSLERTAGAAAAFDNLYLPRLHAHGRVAPDVRRGGVPNQSPGGHVMESVPGLYSDVLVLDFKSLYPSIVRTWRIDPLGLAEPGDEPVPGLGGASFARERHVLPGLIGELWEARDAAKAACDAGLSQAIKIIMNSFYGVLATDACRFFDLRLATNIVRRGHEVITGSRAFIEAAGHTVVYGDTDSLFVLPAPGSDSPDALGAALAHDLDAHWRALLAAEIGVESRLEVQFERRYARFFMPTLRGAATGSKKRYAGLVDDAASGEPELIVKGLEAVRTDWTPLAREFQRELLRLVLSGGDWEAHVRDTRAALLSGALDERLVYRRRLRRNGGEHPSRAPAHVQAARKLSRPGNWIRYVMTRAGPEPVEALTSAPDHEHYLERQLAPAADVVLKVVGTSWATLTDAQLGLF